MIYNSKNKGVWAKRRGWKVAGSNHCYWEEKSLATKGGWVLLFWTSRAKGDYWEGGNIGEDSGNISYRKQWCLNSAEREEPKRIFASRY